LLLLLLLLLLLPRLTCVCLSLYPLLDKLELVQLNLLDSEDKFVEAFKGCEYLIHTASPFSMSVHNAQTDLVV